MLGLMFFVTLSKETSTETWKKRTNKNYEVITIEVDFMEQLMK